MVEWPYRPTQSCPRLWMEAGERERDRERERQGEIIPFDIYHFFI
jgi:hypothetical protein